MREIVVSGQAMVLKWSVYLAAQKEWMGEGDGVVEKARGAWKCCSCV